MKRLLKIVAVLVILLIVAVVGVVFYIDSIAKRAVEYAGTSALGVETTLDSISIGLLGGTVALDNLKVANPQGQSFTSPHFFKLDDVSVGVSLASLRKDTVVIPSLKLDGMEMYLEKKGAKANYQIIMDNLSKGESEPAEPGETAPAKKFIIKDMVLTNISVEADLLPLGGALTKTRISIPEIRLTNVGSESEGGVVLKELSGIVIKAIMQAIIDKSDVLPAALIADLGKGLGELEDIKADTLKTIGGVSDDLNKTIGEASKGIGEAAESVDKVTKGLEGLLGGKKKDKQAEEKADEKK